MGKTNSILVVDDDVASLVELTSILQPEYKVSTVKSGSDALELLDLQLFDLILLDVMMPNMSGFDVLRIIREDERTRDIPTIFITGSESGEVEGLSLGAVDYILKPFEPVVVKHRVDNQIKMLRLNRELEYAAENATKLALVAQAANRSKSSFIVHMVRDMGVPLSNIISLVRKLARIEDLPANVSDDLQAVRSSCNLMVGLSNDLLDFTKLEVESLEILPFQYDFKKLMKEVVHTAFSSRENSCVSFQLDFEESLPALLIGDEFRIKQVLRIILSNAFKFTKEGKVTLSVKSELKYNEFSLLFIIKDTGCGMSSEQLDILYTGYQRLTLNPKGGESMGFGMPIVKRLLALMDGDIAVKSSVNVGTTCTVKIPQKPVGKTTLTLKDLEELHSIKS